MVQFPPRSTLAFYLRLFAPWRPTRLAAAILPPALFFLVDDRAVAPTEEATLRCLHPEAFDPYARRVRRWFGRRRAGS